MSTTPASPLRLGFIGCGDFARVVHFPAIADTYFPGVAGIADLKVTAVCDQDAKRSAAAAHRFGLSANATFADFKQMLDRAQLDAVAVVGPPALHVAAAKELLQRQIPFFVEKPIALTVEDARELQRLAARHGDCGQVGYTSRYAPAHRLAWRISRAPEFGPISDITTTHLTMERMHTFWGVSDPVEAFIYLHGVHGIDLWRFFGGDPVEVAASVSARTRVDDHHSFGSVLAYVRTADNGPHGTIRLKAGAAHNGEVSSDISGQNTRVRVENNQHLTYQHNQDWIRKLMAGDPVEKQFLREQPTGEFLSTGALSHTYFPDFFRIEWTAFAQAVLQGQPLSPSITDACKTTFLTDAIIRSLRNDGSLIKVDYS